MKKIWIIIFSCFILASSFTNNSGDPAAKASRAYRKKKKLPS